MTENKEFKPSKDLPAIPPPLEKLSPPNESSPKWTVSLEELTNLLNTWRNNREDFEKYKGWVILPKKYRDRLWNLTKDWISIIFNDYCKLSAPNTLLLLYELNWRLEKTLTPLAFYQWINVITSVVNEFNPYPQLIPVEKSTTKSGENIITPDKKEYQGKEWKWEEITRAWVELAFALLRSARDEQNKDSFVLWKNKLKNIVSQNLQWQSRWYYEQCLFHLSRLENDLVFQIVEQWELSESNIPDFWKIRRASVLAQLGELKEAKRITQLTLNHLRSLVEPYEINYHLLSQEGWAMLADSNIQAQFNLSKTSLDNVFEQENKNRNRWEYLNQYHCDPNDEFERLKLILEQKPPQPEEQRKEESAFLPGYTSTTIRFGNSDFLSTIRPAFELLRIFEEGGIPLKLINIGFYTKDIKNASQWITPFFPSWSFLTFIQVCQTKSIKELLSFTDVVLLPQEEINYLYEIIDTFFSKVIEQLSNLRKNAIYSNEYLSSKLEVFTETLSYLCIRLNDNQLHKVFQLAVKMYKIEAFRKDYAVFNLPCKLFRKLFYVLSDCEIIKKLDILLSLPIIGESGFISYAPENFADPFDYLIFDNDFTIYDNFDREQWSESINRLINIISNDTPETRKRAIVRLGTLSRISGLTSEQEKLFAQALYSQGNNKIPSNIDGYNSFAILLFLPENINGQAKKIICKYIIDNLKSINNLTFNSSGHFDTLNKLLKDIDYVTTPLEINSSFHEKYINWSQEQAEYFLNIINDFWQQNKDSLIKIYNDKNHLLLQHLYKLIQNIDNCLSTVILPRLQNSNNEIQQRVNQLISDFEHHKIPILSTIPMILFIDESRNINDIAKKLIFGLSSLNQMEINSATIGIKNWLICSQQKQIAEPPSQLLNELIARVIYYRQPRFSWAVSVLGDIIHVFPDILNQEQIKSLLVGLEYLLEETKLPDNWLNWKIFKRDINTLIDIEERPIYTEYCSYLAYRLYQIYEQRQDETPEILKNWKQNSLENVFPKVRKIWKK